MSESCGSRGLGCVYARNRINTTSDVAVRPYGTWLVHMVQAIDPNVDDEDIAAVDDAVAPVTATEVTSPAQRGDSGVGEVVAVLGHELLTPLTAIQGVLDLVLAGIAGDVPAPLRSLLETMHGNGRRLERTITNILDIERIETGAGSLNRGILVVEDIVTSAVEFCAEDAAPSDVQVRVVVLAPQARVWGDESRLRDAIAHVIGNALKFSPAGAVVTVCLTEHEGTVRVLVEDQGPGIPEEARERVFHKFAQLDVTDTRETGGLGLGLTIAKAIIEKHNGAVDFECGHNGGTTFFIDLPACDRPSA